MIILDGNYRATLLQHVAADCLPRFLGGTWEVRAPLTVAVTVGATVTATVTPQSPLDSLGEPPAPPPTGVPEFLVDLAAQVRALAPRNC